jgi:hypothetical protein
VYTADYTPGTVLCTPYRALKTVRFVDRNVGKFSITTTVVMVAWLCHFSPKLAVNDRDIAHEEVA